MRDHVVGRALWPVFEQHDPRTVDLVCYSSGAHDEMSRRFQQRADRWRETAELSDERLAAQIVQDEIDVLVDLALHTSDNRLAAFARKPAPVQVTWLGYPGTTGLQTIDYRLTDPFLDPPGKDDDAPFERPFRLPHTWTIYGPPPSPPEPNTLPALRHGHITFGASITW